MTTARENFLALLLEGNNNRHQRLLLAEILGNERAELARNEDTGRWELNLYGLGLATEAALGLEAWDHCRHCAAMVTHDLSSFRCWDVTGLIEELRLP